MNSTSGENDAALVTLLSNSLKAVLVKALTVGGAMVDTIAIIEDDLIERISMTNAAKTFLLLEQGSKTEAASISTHCGGGAINAAISLARQGYDVSVLAKTGDDQRSGLIQERLVVEGVGISTLVRTATSPTGASIIISAHDRNAAVFTFRGANTLLDVSNLDGVSVDVDLVYVSTLSGASADILPAIVAKVACGQAKIIVNPGVRQIATRFPALCKLLPDISIIALNRLEAESFARQAVAELSGSENATLRRIAAASLGPGGDTRASRHDSASALISGLRRLGANMVLLTDGKHGAYVGNASEILFCPALEGEVVSSVGAGDAFVSTFAGTLVRSGCCATAMVAGAINALSVISGTGAHAGLLCREQLEQRAAESHLRAAVERWNAG